LEQEDTPGKTEMLVIKELVGIADPYSCLGVYYPVIPLELSPLRFRVVLPLEAASECADVAIALWREQFSRVWDRLPLRVGIIAFEGTLPFQAVIEATRNLEDMLAKENKELWRISAHEKRHGVVSLTLEREDKQITLRVLPATMPDGREDLFYPYVEVQDRDPRNPRDFRDPHGKVYRHVGDLQVGDGVRVVPARVAFLFMDSTGSRFRVTEPLYAEDWEEMQEISRLLERVAPSQTALHGLDSALTRLEQDWRGTPDKPSPDLWHDTIRALIAHHLKANGSALETLTEAAIRGILRHALEWQITALKSTT